MTLTLSSNSKACTFFEHNRWLVHTFTSSRKDIRGKKVNVKDELERHTDIIGIETSAGIYHSVVVERRHQDTINHRKSSSQLLANIILLTFEPIRSVGFRADSSVSINQGRALKIFRASVFSFKSSFCYVGYVMNLRLE